MTELLQAIARLRAAQWVDAAADVVRDLQVAVDYQAAIERLHILRYAFDTLATPGQE